MHVGSFPLSRLMYLCLFVCYVCILIKSSPTEPYLGALVIGNLLQNESFDCEKCISPIWTVPASLPNLFFFFSNCPKRPPLKSSTWTDRNSFLCLPHHFLLTPPFFALELNELGASLFPFSSPLYMPSIDASNDSWNWKTFTTVSAEPCDSTNLMATENQNPQIKV